MSQINSFVKCNDESFWFSSKCHMKSDNIKKTKKIEKYLMSLGTENFY